MRNIAFSNDVKTSDSEFKVSGNVMSLIDSKKYEIIEQMNLEDELVEKIKEVLSFLLSSNTDKRKSIQFSNEKVLIFC